MIELANVLQAISDLEIRLVELAHAFPASEVRELAAARGWLRTAGDTSKARAVGRAPQALKTGAALIEVLHPSGKGVPARYNRGQSLPRFVPGAFKALLDASGENFEAELAKCFSSEGKSYFGTSEGARELAKFVNFVKTRKANPKRTQPGKGAD